jgi:MFS family permease
MLGAAFLGWLCAGVEMGLGPLIARPAIRDLLFGVRSELTTHLTSAQEGQVGRWFAWYLCAFLLGAAVGGPIFGILGDRRGRVRALAFSILTFSIFTGLSWWVQSPEQLLILRFLASLGIGGVWPAAVALIAEAWPEAGRPTVAGALGTAANIGIFLMAITGQWLEISPRSWRWAMVVGALPALLGILVFAFVPESPRWLANRSKPATKQRPLSEVFRPPLLSRTLLGIVLGTIPLLGTWASGKWMIPWADAQGVSAAQTQAVWASGAVIGSAAGGVLANLFGRRLTYFLVSLASLGINLAIYRILSPAEQLFLPAVFLLGLVATIFFGWLPLYLPELFPTRVRATGTGVTYNFGRIASAVGVLGAGSLMSYFEGDYARVGAVTAWVYGLGMLVILFAPDTSKHALED